MTDRPILFSGPMVRALIEGRKTQTRRVFKPWPGMQRKWLSMETLHSAPTCYLCEVGGHLGAQMQHPLAGTTQSYGPVDKMSPLGWVRLPYSVGDRLWVREAWRACAQVDQIAPSELSKGEPIRFEADGEILSTGCAMITAGRLRPGIHMPRWASRLTLTVTEVRVQRLQGISEADAIAEGVASTLIRYPDGGHIGSSATGHFAALWDRINGAGSWEANPWVAAYTFTVEPRNIDAMTAEAARCAS